METEIYNKLKATSGDVSLQARLLFDKVWNNLVIKYGNEETFRMPPYILWLNGAPGSGKGSNTRSIMKATNIFSKPVVVSDLLNSDDNKDLIDNGSLIDDEKVVRLVFEKLLDGSCKGGAIIDGYPRTLIQAECAYLLMIKLRQLPKGKNTKFSVVILNVDEKTSVERQLYRGRIAEMNNDNVKRTGVGEFQEIRKTDMDPKFARARYRTFLEQTKEALEFMKKVTEAHEISAAGSFEEIKTRIYESLRKKM
ncbi:MAG: nucleoside monophosphate kinase [Puniceicoccales bacterium]|nr:nucleoside monophosphate kinase [Puniceicoccales bacterium]